MAKIIIPQKKTATLELQLDGEDICIQYPVDSIAGYREITEVLKDYREVGEKTTILNGKDKVTNNQSIDILDQSIALIERFRSAVKITIRAEQYDKYLKPVEDDIPFMAWVQILTEIIKAYTDYFGQVTSTEGEL